MTPKNLRHFRVLVFDGIVGSEDAPKDGILWVRSFMASSQKTTVGKELVWVVCDKLADNFRTPVRSDENPQVIVLRHTDMCAIAEGRTLSMPVGEQEIKLQLRSRIDRVMLVKKSCVFWLEPESFEDYLAKGKISKYLMAWTPEGIDSNSRDRNRLS